MLYKQLLMMREEAETSANRDRRTQYDFDRLLRLSFRDDVARLFRDHQGLYDFQWNQATDPFDGHQFSVSRDGVQLNTQTLELRDDTLAAAKKDVLDILRFYTDEEFKSLFGDHVTVTVGKFVTRVEFFDVEKVVP